MNEQDRHNLFSELIARYHSELYAYIFAIVRNREDAEDLFQSVCLVLWRKFESFQPGSSFFSWARQTAKLMVCNFLRHKRKLPSCVGEELLDALAETVSEAQGDEGRSLSGRLAALQGKAWRHRRGVASSFVTSKGLAAAKSPTDCSDSNRVCVDR